MGQISARVENQKQNSQHVVSSAHVHHPKVAALLAPMLPGISIEVISQVIGAIAFVLEGSTKTLEQLESAYVEEQSDDEGYRLGRDQAASEGQEALGNVDHRLQSIPHKQDLPKKYGIPTVQPATPSQLSTVLTNTGTLLINAKETYIDAFGQEVHPKILGNVLLEKARVLDKALEDIKREQRELQDALFERDRALEQWGEIYQGVASALEGLYRLAGLRELADRIRPTIRRRRGEETPTQPIDDPNLSNPTPSTTTG